MFKLALIFVLVGVSLAQAPPKPVVGLLRSDFVQPNVDGAYSFNFESEDGIAREETGELEEPEAYKMVGSYSYKTEDGATVKVTYVADKNGFRPVTSVTFK